MNAPRWSSCAQEAAFTRLNSDRGNATQASLWRALIAKEMKSYSEGEFVKEPCRGGASTTGDSVCPEELTQSGLQARIFQFFWKACAFNTMKELLCLQAMHDRVQACTQREIRFWQNATCERKKYESNAPTIVNVKSELWQYFYNVTPVTAHKVLSGLQRLN